MLPECRNNDATFSIPKFAVEKKEVEDFIDELKGFHEEFYDCFSRSESRENFFRYTSGQLSKLERKSIEPIALNIQGGNVRSMQKFISDVVWDESEILRTYHHMVNEDMGDPSGVLIFDESGFVKKARILPELQNSIVVIWARLKIVKLEFLLLMRLLRAMLY